jgi:TetR/AcrR family transcriptional repressor of nem operon
MARSTKEVARANRERVLTEASGRFNESGLNGIGVADLMAAAGLTHGGFYRHFASKEHLAAEAVERAARASAAEWCAKGENARAAGRSGALDDILDTYLSDGHRDALAGGCTVAGLAGELVRLPGHVRSGVTSGIEAMIESLAAEMPASSKADRKDDATFALGAMVGALVLARLGLGGEHGLIRAADRLKAWAADRADDDPARTTSAGSAS